MRHVLLAAAAIGAVSAIGLSLSNRTGPTPALELKPTPAGYSFDVPAADPASPGLDTFALAAPPPPAGPGPVPAELDAAAAEVAAAVEDATTVTAGDDAPARPRFDTKVEKVRRGDTLMTLLARAGAVGNAAHEAVRALRAVYNPKALQIGQEIRLTFAPASDDDDQPDLHAIELQASIEKDVAVHRTESGEFRSQETGRVLKHSLGRGGALIETSLFKAGTQAGVPVEVMFELIRAFSYDVDFQRDMQPGDSFEVMFEQTHDATGKLVRTGHMIYGALTLQGTLLELYRYVPNDTHQPDYFNPKGESVKKALLKTPVDGAKLTSGFGMRNHPILGYSRMHRGVDFGAPSGTPIMAAGDGVIDMAGANGAYGNYVRIRHGGAYQTAYAHMSRIGPNIRRGAVVRQGQVIGYVGATGLATGPHLHYEVLSNDHQINPMSIKLPTGRQLAGTELKRFNVAMGEIERTIRALPDPFTVASSQR